MLKTIDDWLNRVTMYRLLLYILTALLVLAAVLGAFHLMPYSPAALGLSTMVLVLASWLTNKFCAWFLKVQTNVESVYLTALILALIISPPPVSGFLHNLPFLIWVSVLSQVSKYVINFKNKHLFNPAALAVAITAATLNQSASWWVGNPAMFIFVLIGALLMARKVRKVEGVIALLIAATATVFVLTRNQSSLLNTVFRIYLDSPLLFFAAVMFTEPLTAPPTMDGRIAYGVLVGWLFAPQTHFGSFYLTPELALLIGNVFSYLISPKTRHVFRLKEKRPIAQGVYDFVFEKDQPFKFKPGQYMEWTLGHKKTDARGNRRYFTLASSPSENEVILGVKFYDQASSFKRMLANLKPGDTIAAGQLAGDFTLPKNPKEKLAFIAGGIGVTPYRSMLKYLIDKGEKRDIVMLYSNRTFEEFAYQNILEQAWKNLGVRIVATLTSRAPENWPGYTGYFTPEIIAKEVPDFKRRTFYISGSHTVVEAFKKDLRQLGVPRWKIKTDFFPGLV